MAEQTLKDLRAQVELLETMRDRDSQRFAPVLDAARIAASTTATLNDQEALQRAIAKYDEGADASPVPYIPRAVAAWLQAQAQRYLQTVFESDPAAAHCLMVNRVRANEALTEHPHAVCDAIRVLPAGAERATITALGLVSGLLTALGLEPVPAHFDTVTHELRGFVPPARNPNRFLQQWEASPLMIEALKQAQIDELRSLGCKITEIQDNLTVDVPANAWQMAVTMLSRQYPAPKYVATVKASPEIMDACEKKGFQWLRVQTGDEESLQVSVPMDQIAQFKDMTRAQS